MQDYLVSLRTLLAPVESAMLVPGRLEKWNIIVEARSFNDGVVKKNKTAIMASLVKTMNAYPYRLNRVFLIYMNPKSLLPRLLGPSTTTCE